MASPEPLLTVAVPISLPSASEIREIIRAAATEVAERESRWLSAEDAARHCGWSLRTFRRKRDQLGIPYSEIDGLQRYLVADLDAVMTKHLVFPSGSQVIEFPSAAMHAAATQAA